MKKLLILSVFAMGLCAQISTINNESAATARTKINANFVWLEGEKMSYLGAYAGGTTYGKNAVVLSSSIMYVSLQAANVGRTPAANASWWTPFPGSGGGGGLVREYAAAICQSAAGSLALSADTTLSPVPDCVIGTNGVIFGVAKFDDAASHAVQGHLWLPATVTTLTADIGWRTSVANTGVSAVWQLRTVCVADNESDDPVWNAAQTVTTAAKSVASRRIVSTIASVTLTGCAAGERLYWQLLRDPAHASDTLGATAELQSVKLTVQ